MIIIIRALFFPTVGQPFDVDQIINHATLVEQEAQLSLGWADHIFYISRPTFNFNARKKSIFQSDCSLIQALLNATSNARIKYGNLAHM